MYEKYCSKCGTTQTIIPLNDGGYCYEKLHFVTKDPFNKKYEVAEN